MDGNDSWKDDDTTGNYNIDLIQKRLQALECARLSGDINCMQHLIRTALSRDLGGMGDVDLYRHSYVGTKKLIERYVESAIKTIDAVVSQSVVNVDVEPRDLLESVLYSRQSFGRSALLLSGGGTFGMTHVGVIKTLFEARLLPRIISGASAGSIVCAAVCTLADEEIPTFFRQFPYGDLAVFEADDSKMTLVDHVRRLLTKGSWSDIENLTRVMRGLTGDLTFQEAYNRSRRILNICVSTTSLYELPRLLNYVTAPNVLIWSAVVASCSVPFVFTSSLLLAKDPITGKHHPWNPTPQRFIDGSVDNDLPMTRLAEMFNVNHFIVSQVNPHVVPFLPKDDHRCPEDGLSPGKRRRDQLDWVYTMGNMAREEALHRLQFMAEMRLFPNFMTKCRSILSQKYSGDITILPEITMNDLPRLLSNPTTDFMLRSCLLGERATWPKLSRIRDQCAIELALDHAVHQLRTRVVFSEYTLGFRMPLDSGGIQERARGLVFISSQLPEDSSAIKQDRQGRLNRRRRRSGGSVQTLAENCAMTDGGAFATADIGFPDKDLEIRLRYINRESLDVPPKPRLKRASRSHNHIPQHHTFRAAGSVQVDY